MLLIILIAVAIFVIVCIYIYAKSHKKSISPIICYSGRNGSGKTFNSSIDVVKLHKKSSLKWFLSNKLFFKNELKGQPKPKVYSNYPIILEKKKFKKKYNKYHFNITKDFIYETLTYDCYKIKGKIYYRLNKKYIVRLSEPLKIGYINNTEPFETGSQVVIDEFSKFLNQFITIKDKEYTKELENISDNITFWRHYHGNNSHFVVTSQVTNEINHNVRYKLNQAIAFDSTHHYFFGLIHISKYRVIDLTDNIKSIDETNTENKDLNDKYTTIVHFGKCRLYDDRAFSERYRALDNGKMSNSPLKVCTLLKPVVKNDYNNIIKTFDIKKLPCDSSAEYNSAEL